MQKIPCRCQCNAHTVSDFSETASRPLLSNIRRAIESRRPWHTNSFDEIELSVAPEMSFSHDTLFVWRKPVVLLNFKLWNCFNYKFSIMSKVDTTIRLQVSNDRRPCQFIVRRLTFDVLKHQTSLFVFEIQSVISFRNFNFSMEHRVSVSATGPVGKSKDGRHMFQCRVCVDLVGMDTFQIPNYHVASFRMQHRRCFRNFYVFEWHFWKVDNIANATRCCSKRANTVNTVVNVSQKWREVRERLRPPQRGTGPEKTKWKVVLRLLEWEWRKCCKRSLTWRRCTSSRLQKLVTSALAKWVDTWRETDGGRIPGSAVGTVQDVIKTDPSGSQTETWTRQRTYCW